MGQWENTTKVFVILIKINAPIIEKVLSLGEVYSFYSKLLLIQSAFLEVLMGWAGLSPTFDQLELARIWIAFVWLVAKLRPNFLYRQSTSSEMGLCLLEAHPRYYIQLN